MPVYYKVYNSRSEMDGKFHITTLNGIEDFVYDDFREKYTFDVSLNKHLYKSPVVIEPIWLSEEDFENLPDFEGF